MRRQRQQQQREIKLRKAQEESLVKAQVERVRKSPLLPPDGHLNAASGLRATVLEASAASFAIRVYLSMRIAAISADLKATAPRSAQHQAAEKTRSMKNIGKSTGNAVTRPRKRARVKESPEETTKRAKTVPKLKETQETRSNQRELTARGTRHSRPKQ